MLEATVSIAEGALPRRFPVKDAWYKAYLRGNSLWPMVDFGIFPLSVEAVLRDPPFSWEQYKSSQVSQTQVEGILQAVAHIHAAHGIPVFPGSVLPGKEKADHPRVITEDRAREMWGEVQFNVMRYIGKAQPSPLPEMVNTSDPRFQGLQQVMGVVRRVFLSKDGQVVAGHFRDTYRRDLSKEDVLIRTAEFVELLEKHGIKLNSRTNKRALCQDIIRKLVSVELRSLSAAVEYEYRRWLSELLHC